MRCLSTTKLPRHTLFPSLTLIRLEMDAVERIIQHAVAKSRDGRIDVSDFLNEAAGSMRYGMFTPMEVRATLFLHPGEAYWLTSWQANIIWHFASRGGMGASQRLALADFQALLDAKVRFHDLLFIPPRTDLDTPQWQPPQASVQTAQTTSASFLSQLTESTYNFVQGGIAGGIGAFVCALRSTESVLNQQSRRSILLI